MLGRLSLFLLVTFQAGCGCLPEKADRRGLPDAGDEDTGPDADSDSDTDTGSESESESETTTEGVCDPPCKEGYLCCAGAGIWGGDACVNIEGSPSHCGGCGIDCPDGFPCWEGECQCTPSDLECDGVCTTISWDPQNCGECGNVCPAETPRCAGGECLTCESAGDANCDGSCADLNASEDNCGACDSPCEEGVCTAGACVTESECDAECSAGLLCCEGAWDFFGGETEGPTCTDPDWDYLNCGGCNNVCGDLELCASGICTCIGLECDDGCIDPYSDPANCGDCDIACADTEQCCSGECIDADAECDIAG